MQELITPADVESGGGLLDGYLVVYWPQSRDLSDTGSGYLTLAFSLFARWRPHLYMCQKIWKIMFLHLFESVFDTS